VQLPWVVEMPPRATWFLHWRRARNALGQPSCLGVSRSWSSDYCYCRVGGTCCDPRRQKQPETLTIIHSHLPGLKSGQLFAGWEPDSASPGTVLKRVPIRSLHQAVGQERVVQLTHHPAIFLSSAWSPDGRFIAFMRQTDSGRSGIYLISALGGSERSWSISLLEVRWVLAGRRTASAGIR